ncbi:metallophosphoesterase [Hymenobacter sp. HD11105]|jgi:hypothetical protein
MYDIIGDIHGHADELVALLHHLGYQEQSGVFRHPSRQVIFLGDFVDRGPKIRETLRIARSMVESGAALAVMGNHEYNALCFAALHPSGGHLRPHTPRNIMQHVETIRQFQNHFDEWRDYLAWFRTLPLFLDLGALRAVHACWDQRHIDFLTTFLDNGCLSNDDLLWRATRRGSPERQAVEDTLKGKESTLPEGFTFADKDGNVRRQMRVRWWCNPVECTYGDYYLESLPDLDPHPVDHSALPDAFYYQDTTPVFFGHYWLHGDPQLLKPHAACLDYSVAKGGQLVAYRWNGEQELVPASLVWVAKKELV